MLILYYVWEQERLGNVGDFKSSSVDKIIRKNDLSIFLLNFMDVYKGVKITSKNLSINTANKSQISSFNILKSDVFFTPSSETRNDLGFAKTALETIEQGVFSYHLIRYRQKNKTFYESFIDYIVRTSRYRIIFYKEAVGAQRYVLSIKTFNNTVIPKPTIQEQERIVFLLNIIDSLITLHQRELKILKIFKKSLFQKMIISKNLIILSVSLTKMTNVWEQERLGNLYQFGKSGGTPLSSNKEFYNGHIPFLSITDISNSDTYIYKTEKNITLKGLKNSSAWIVPKDSISLAMYASIGKVAILKDNVSTSQAIFNMVFSDELNLRDFIFYALKRMELLKLWNSLSSSGTQSNLTSEIIKNYKITLTKNFSERHKINKLFNKIYSLITLHQRGQFRRENEKKIRNFVL
ncbi:restriction endonuclease subunit S [Mycoplasmopsis cynos]|uniref:restriction endonuclease subunit S n=1 Tax=Mycoplasmopsis cynos TaxID=171284 RepID=UPI002AFF8B90|nr:restriction endonuclease subunit S [Mycoplasmopsis cynos]WQQ14770.1 restriction endonuclease subunit S [Mycoplasmopsis cynos]